MQKTAALLAILLASPMTGFANGRAPEPPGEGWIHVSSNCHDAEGVADCFSHWARKAGRRGKNTFMDSTLTYHGQSEKDRSFVLQQAVNCDEWEIKDISSWKRSGDWRPIPIGTVQDGSARIVCE